MRERDEDAYVALIVSDPVQTTTKQRRKKTQGDATRRGGQAGGVGAEGSKGARSGRKLRQEGEERRGAYLTWHTGRVSRHILIEFFSRSRNAGISP